MNKAIGIVICNYNKQEYIIKCIQSVLHSSIDDFDIYVVDNASTDDSVSKIEKNFTNQVILIKNKENLGGSGGFNSGLKEAIKHNYKYLMCVDNDIVMDPQNIEKLYSYMEKNPETGMAGSRIMIMDQPAKIQAMGAKLDFQKYGFKDNYRNYMMDDSVPEVVECDYVPACSMMIRKEVIDKIGLIPDDTFIYWDDMEWGYKCKEAGYRIESIADAVAWHKGNFKNTTTFPKYYMWRNRIAFFMKYIQEEKKEEFVEKILSELFQMVYGSYYKKEYKLIDTLMFALDDAIHGIRGKATEGKIFERDKNIHRIDIRFSNEKSAYIEFNGDYEALEEITKRLWKINTSMKIAVIAEETEIDRLKVQFPLIKVITKKSENKEPILRMCSHIFEVIDYNADYIYIDKYCNLIENINDYTYCKNFKKNQELFIKCKKAVFMNYIR